MTMLRELICRKHQKKHLHFHILLKISRLLLLCSYFDDYKDMNYTYASIFMHLSY